MVYEKRDAQTLKVIRCLTPCDERADVGGNTAYVATMVISKDEYYIKANRCETSGAIISPASCLTRIVSLLGVALTVETPLVELKSRSK